MALIAAAQKPQKKTIAEQVITGAKIVMEDAVIEGSLLLRDGLIADVAKGASGASRAYDCEGDYILPGLVELHTDAIERHLSPRTGVAWPEKPAAMAHDREFAAHGVTTLFDALRVGSEFNEAIGDYAGGALAAIDALREAALLLCDHYLHLRCELCAPSMESEFQALAEHPRLRMISLMDHTVGQRQFRDDAQNRAYYLEHKALSEAEMATEIEKSRRFQQEFAANSRKIAVARANDIATSGGFCALAGHDDATEADVAESLSSGATIAEFPTTQEAARLCRKAGLKILMGAPNLLRGKSHSGNVSATELAKDGLVDILSSDYAPASLLPAAFRLEEKAGYSLPEAVATASRNPALAVGLDDRGAIRTGLRADLVRVVRKAGVIAPRAVWRGGIRTA